jgi:hypothetical protein
MYMNQMDDYRIYQTGRRLSLQTERHGRDHVLGGNERVLEE